MQGYGLHLVIALISILFLYFIFSPSKPSSTLHADDTIVRAVIFFRHADRGPITTFPGDPHPHTDRQKWPHGTDGLTKKGKRDSFALGKVLRKRYKNFLPEHYYPTDVIAYSTSKERTLTTAALLLAGLYPPTAEELWSEELPWHPIPIYQEITFNMTNGIMCPRYKEEVLKMFHEYNETFIKENEQILAYIGANTGLDFKKDPFVAFISVADCLNMQSRNGLELPEWAKDIFPYKMMPLLTDLYNRYSIGTDIQLQLGGGLVMQRVLDIFKMGKRKMYLSAGHDVTLMMLLGALGVPRPVAIPEPTGSVILELHNVSGTSIVKAYSLKSSSYNQFETLQMSCGLNECILSDFEVMTSNLTVSDYHRLCNEISPDFKMNISSTLVAIGGAPVPLY